MKGGFFLIMMGLLESKNEGLYPSVVNLCPCCKLPLKSSYSKYYCLDCNFSLILPTSEFTSNRLTRLTEHFSRKINNPEFSTFTFNQSVHYCGQIEEVTLFNHPIRKGFTPRHLPNVEKRKDIHSRSLLAIESSNRRRIREIRRIINTNRSKNTKFLTLTFNHDISLDDANYEFDKFIKRLKYHMKKNKVRKSLKYFCVPEFQSCGRPHYHLLLFDFDFYPIEDEYVTFEGIKTESEFRQYMQSIFDFDFWILEVKEIMELKRFFFRKGLTSLWKNGFTWINSVDSIENLGSYLSKYLRKSLKLTPYRKNQRVYSCSQLLKRPVVLTDNHHSYNFSKVRILSYYPKSEEYPRVKVYICMRN